MSSMEGRAAGMVHDFTIVSQIVGALREQGLADEQPAQATADLCDSLQALFRSLARCVPLAGNPQAGQLLDRLHASVVGAVRSLASCFVSRRNSVVDHELGKCVLFVAAEVRRFVAQLLLVLGQPAQFEGRGAADLDACYEVLCCGMRGGAGRGASADAEEKVGGVSEQGMDWERESLVEACQATAEVIDRVWRDLEMALSRMHAHLASTAGGIDEVLSRVKSDAPCVLMAQLREKVQGFLNDPRGLQVPVAQPVHPAPSDPRASETGEHTGLENSSSAADSSRVQERPVASQPSVPDSSDSKGQPDQQFLRVLKMSLNAGIKQERVTGLVKGESELSGQTCLESTDSLSSAGGEPLASVDKSSGQEQIPTSHTSHLFLEDVEKVKGKLLSRDGPVWVVIIGKDGFGKTSLAGNACRSPDVMDRFLGGVFWVSLGRFPDLTALQSRLLEDITGCRETFASVADGLAALSKQLAERLPCVLVMDDVWEAEHLKGFAVYDNTARGKCLVTTQHINVLDWTSKEEVVLLPRGEQEAADLFSCVFTSCVSPPSASPLTSEAGFVEEYVKLCDGVPLILHAFGSSFSGERDKHKLDKLRKMVETCKGESSEGYDSGSLSRAAAKTGLPDDDSRDADTSPSYSERKTPDEHEGLLPAVNETVEKAKLPDTQRISHSQKVLDEELLKVRHPATLQGLRGLLFKHIGHRKVNNANATEEEDEGQQDSHLYHSRHMLVPLLLSLDSLAAIHPVLLDRFLDLAAFPKGEYVSTCRVQDVWEAGRVQDNSYTLILLGLFASRAMVEWSLDPRQGNGSFKDTGNSFCWRLPALFHDLAQVVINLDNETLVQVSNYQKSGGTVDQGPIQQTVRQGIQEVEMTPVTSAALSQGRHSGEEARAFDWECILERILHLGVKARSASFSSLDQLLNGNRRGSTDSSTGATSIVDEAVNKRTEFVGKYLQFSSLTPRLFSPASQENRFPIGWVDDSISMVTKKLSIDRCNISHLPDSLNFPCLRVALLGNNGLLKEIPSPTFNSMGNLEVLEFKGCSALRALPKAICFLQSLKLFDLSDCTCLQVIPTSISKLTSLVHFRLARCVSLTSLPQSMCSLTRLESLDISGCSKLRCLPANIGSLRSLKYLCLKGCTALQSIPRSITQLNSLVSVDFTECRSLVYTPPYLNRLVASFQGVPPMVVPPGIWKMTNLETLHLSSIMRLTFVPSTVAQLAHVRQLDLSGCRSLEYLPQELGSLTSLEELDLSSTALRKLPPAIGNLANLLHLYLRDCPRLLSLPPTIASLPKLQVLELSHCWDLIVIPASFGESDSFRELGELNISGCGFKSLPPFSPGACQKLRKLNLSACFNLASLPSGLGGLQLLEVLNLDGCRTLSSLRDIGSAGVSSLAHLSLRNCTALTSLPAAELSQLKTLKYLDVSGCPANPIPEVILARARSQELKLIRWGAIWKG